MYYKIKNKSGYYSTGGMNPKFSKTGKIWTLPHLRSHLTTIGGIHNNFTIYKDCTLIKFIESYDLVTLADILRPIEEKLLINILRGNS